MSKTLEQLYDYTLSFYGLPYIWGGDGTPKYFGGYDCSGLCQKFMEFLGMDPPGDQNADAYYRHFLNTGQVNLWGFGALSFYGSTSRITHIGFCYDKKTMINAAGGGEECTTPAIAKALGASVKIQPIRFHRNLIACIMPPYAEHGIL